MQCKNNIIKITTQFFFRYPQIPALSSLKLLLDIKIKKKCTFIFINVIKKKELSLNLRRFSLLHILQGWIDSTREELKHETATLIVEFEPSQLNILSFNLLRSENSKVLSKENQKLVNYSFIHSLSSYICLLSGKPYWAHSDLVSATGL